MVKFSAVLLAASVAGLHDFARVKRQGVLVPSTPVLSTTPSAVPIASPTTAATPATTATPSSPAPTAVVTPTPVIASPSEIKSTPNIIASILPSIPAALSSDVSKATSVAGTLISSIIPSRILSTATVASTSTGIASLASNTNSLPPLPTATPVSESSSGGGGISRPTLIAIIVAASVVAGIAAIWTIIRKTAFSPSKNFEGRLAPVVGEKPGAYGNGADEYNSSANLGLKREDSRDSAPYGGNGGNNYPQQSQYSNAQYGNQQAGYPAQPHDYGYGNVQRNQVPTSNSGYQNNLYYEGNQQQSYQPHQQRY